MTKGDHLPKQQKSQQIHPPACINEAKEGTCMEPHKNKYNMIKVRNMKKFFSISWRWLVNSTTLISKTKSKLPVNMPHCNVTLQRISEKCGHIKLCESGR